MSLLVKNIPVRCPPPPPYEDIILMGRAVDRINFVLDDVAKVLRSCDPDFYNSEHNFVIALKRSMSRAGKAQVPLPMQRLLMRPDPGLVFRLANQSILKGKEYINQQDALEISKLLVDPSVEYRTGDSFSSICSSNKRTLYPTSDYALNTFVRIRDANFGYDSDNFIAKSIFSYAEIALSHPLPDGNGRLARIFM